MGIENKSIDWPRTDGYSWVEVEIEGRTVRVSLSNYLGGSFWSGIVFKLEALYKNEMIKNKDYGVEVERLVSEEELAAWRVFVSGGQIDEVNKRKLFAALPMHLGGAYFDENRTRYLNRQKSNGKVVGKFLK